MACEQVLAAQSSPIPTELRSFWVQHGCRRTLELQRLHAHPCYELIHIPRGERPCGGWRSSRPLRHPRRSLLSAGARPCRTPSSATDSCPTCSCIELRVFYFLPDLVDVQRRALSESSSPTDRLLDARAAQPAFPRRGGPTRSAIVYARCARPNPRTHTVALVASTARSTAWQCASPARPLADHETSSDRFPRRGDGAARLGARAHPHVATSEPLDARRGRARGRR